MSAPPTGPGARDVARRVLRRISGDQAFAALALDAELSRAELPERERKLATELCYGVCRHMTRLDRAIASATSRGRIKVKPAVRAILRVGAYQLLFLDRVPAHAAVDDAVHAARRAGGARMAGFVNSVLRRLARTGEPALPGAENPLEYVRIAYSLPGWIAERLAQTSGHDDEFLAAARGFHERPRLAIRVNRERTTVAELAGLLAAEKPGCDVGRSPVCPGALLVTGLGDPGRSPSFARGLWTVQDIGAQLVGLFLGPVRAPVGHERPTILDACAGVGGKALHLAERVGAEGSLDAADVSAGKLSKMVETGKRLGVAERIRPVVADLTGSAPTDAGLAEDYDRVLLDAPCTGLGVLRRHPEVKWRIRADDVARMADTQRALLDHVSQRVRPGGILLYSVCTFTYEEGPGQIRQFLARHPEFSLQAPEPEPGADAGPYEVSDAVSDAGSDADAISWSELTCALTAGAPASPGTLATWPHRHQADGFFAARLQRRS